MGPGVEGGVAGRGGGGGGGREGGSGGVEVRWEVSLAKLGGGDKILSLIAVIYP